MSRVGSADGLGGTSRAKVVWNICSPDGLSGLDSRIFKRHSRYYNRRKQIEPRGPRTPITARMMWMTRSVRTSQLSQMPQMPLWALRSSMVLVAQATWAAWKLRTILNAPNSWTTCTVSCVPTMISARTIENNARWYLWGGTLWHVRRLSSI